MGRVHICFDDLTPVPELKIWTPKETSDGQG